MRERRDSELLPENIQRQELEILREGEKILDKGIGSCYLRNPECASIVAESVKFFDGVRYELYAWCVMPNHVHAVLSPYPDHSLESITKSWKGFSSRQINKLLGRHGRVWQPETFDHIIRSDLRFWGTIQYVLDNPKKANLVDWPWKWAVTKDQFLE